MPIRPIAPTLHHLLHIPARLSLHLFWTFPWSRPLTAARTTPPARIAHCCHPSGRYSTGAGARINSDDRRIPKTNTRRPNRRDGSSSPREPRTMRTSGSPLDQTPRASSSLRDASPPHAPLLCGHPIAPVFPMERNSSSWPGKNFPQLTDEDHRRRLSVSG